MALFLQAWAASVSSLTLRSWFAPMLAPVSSLHQLTSVNGLIIIKDKELSMNVDTSVLILTVCVFNGLFIM